MAKSLLVFVLFFTVFSGVRAQSGNISGTITDQQAKSPLTRASVQLRSLSDSTIHNTLTDSSGRFTFSNLRRDSFLLSFSFVGYNPVVRKISLDSTDISINVAAVPSSSSQLETVVISTSISPVSQKGDTLQMNASQYKVNPDASGEDLVKKMPGITVENGQVKANGENVQKVTIDGRDLFGDDATAALRNLPAEVIDKIQVFDRLSDQAQFTGFDDGSASKAINIVTKANMRNGQFGRVFAGYGTDGRYSAGGNATILKENRRISLVGNFNNVNQQNFSQQDLLGVTSTNQRGGAGGGNNNRSQRGGQGGGGNNNRGQGGGGGGFGSNSNFLVGQQNGINRTNAFGINYSDQFGKKVTLTGSYFFNSTNNATSEISNTEYFSGGNLFDTTRSGSRNINHRFNLRFEYRFDSSNQIIITPNLSWQDNRSDRLVSSRNTFPAGNTVQEALSQNATNSNRTGNNLNNSILYRHSFAKRGRTFSINLNTSYNQRTGASYTNTFQRSEYYAGGFSDTTSNRFSDQSSDGLQLSANLVYTEPLGLNSQLQFNYNPSRSKSNSDQATFQLDPSSGKYTTFLNTFSNRFQNTTDAQNGGISYRYGNRDRQIAFGVNYQHTNLNSDRQFPIVASVDKSFNNLLPNAMIRYKISTRSSFRLMYRANVIQPSVTQLQDVLDPTNAPSYSIGNPDLNQQYTHFGSTQYTYTNTGKGMLLVGNIFFQTANDYISNATFNSGRDTIVNGAKIPGGYTLSKPVNLDGYVSLRSFVTFAIPLKFIKSNFNLNGGVSFSKLPGINNYVLNETHNTTYNAGAVIASNVSQYVDFTVSYTGNFSHVTNQVQPVSNPDYSQHTVSVQLNLLSKKGFFFQNDLNYQYYAGLEVSDPSYVLWNMSAGKKLFKSQNGEIKVSVFDLLRQNQSISRNVTDYGVQDVTNQVLQRYFMLTFTYNLRNFGTAAARATNRQQAEGGGGFQRF
jgi:hypothetical protein